MAASAAPLVTGQLLAEYEIITKWCVALNTYLIYKLADANIIGGDSMMFLVTESAYLACAPN